MWDPVAWFIGGGAEHSPEVARLLAFAATSGAEGIVAVGDLRVAPLDVPGGAVRVMPGSALVLNRAAGGSSQTYVGRLPVADTVEIAATGSGAGRTDLIVARIEDPFMSGEPWDAPVDPKVGPYVFTRVIPNVPAGTTRVQDVPGHSGSSAVALARVTLPASTGTVTAAMVTDLRVVASPRSVPMLRTYALVGADKSVLTATSAYPVGGQTWPTAVEDAWGELEIPAWATRARIVMTWAGVLCTNNSWGAVWVQVGMTANPDNRKTQEVLWDAQNAAGNYRTAIVAADDIAIPAALRGTRQKFYPRGRKTSGSGTTTLDWGSAMVLQVEFYERAA